MCPFNALEWFLAYLTTPFRKGHVKIRVFDFNMKAQCALFSYRFDHMVEQRTFKCLDDYYHFDALDFTLTENILHIKMLRLCFLLGV